MANDVKYNIEDLASMTAPALTDLLLEARGTASYKLLISDLAKAIVENYAGSSLAGSAQSVKAALDSLNSRMPPIKIINVTSTEQTVTIDKDISTYTGILIGYYINNSSDITGVTFGYVQNFKSVPLIVYNTKNVSEYATLTYVDGTHLKAITTNTGNRYVIITFF